MKNYGIFTNFVFLQVLSQKGENSSRKEEKRGIVAVFVATEFCVSQQTSKQMAKELCHDHIPLS